MKVQHLILVATFFYHAYTELVNGQPRKDCQTSCGRVTIEYPFGTSQGCYYADDPSFKLTCNETDQKLLFGRTIEVINISHSGELRVWNGVSYACYNSKGDLSDDISYTYSLANLSLSRNNKFTLVGCDAFAVLSTTGTRNYSTGCLSACDSLPPANGECNGEGCCSTDVYVPLDSIEFETNPHGYRELTSVLDFNPCIYAFLAENGTFHFNASEDLKNLRNVKEFPVLLDWSIGNQTCDQVGNRSICGTNNSTCFNSTRGTGYNCKCLEGFEGNPYLSNEHSCQDINECTSTIHKHNCSDPSTCRNKDGGFDCKCRSGYRLDTTTMSCKRKDFGWATILLGTTIGFLSILLLITCLQQRMKRLKTAELRQKSFEQNSGGMLIQRLSGPGTPNANVKIFTEEGMKTSTNGYDQSRILGQGGQGTVYKDITRQLHSCYKEGSTRRQ